MHALEPEPLPACGTTVAKSDTPVTQLGVSLVGCLAAGALNRAIFFLLCSAGLPRSFLELGIVDLSSLPCGCICLGFVDSLDMWS